MIVVQDRLSKNRTAEKVQNMCQFNNIGPTQTSVFVFPQGETKVGAQRNHWVSYGTNISGSYNEPVGTASNAFVYCVLTRSYVN